MPRVIHPIEVESYRILRSRIDLSHLPPLSRAVAERVIHAAADLSFGESLVLDEAALEQGREALLRGAPVYCDARMAAAGITSRRPIVPLDDPRAKTPDPGLTRSATAMRLATDERAGRSGDRQRPHRAVRAARAPAAGPGIDRRPAGGLRRRRGGQSSARQSDHPFVTNRGERGGSSVAVAAVNALLYYEA